jgi:cytochrome c-type biogenesis protein CcmE
MVVLVGTLVATVGLVVAALLQHSLSYYRTPSQLTTSAPGGSDVRVEGYVVPGTVHRSGTRVVFEISDGSSQLRVVSTVAPPATFRAGQGAVVEGRLVRDGVLRADQVLVKHSNEYHAAGPAAGAAGAPR